MRGFPVRYPNCLNCGKDLPQYNGKGQPRKYCNRQCAALNRKKIYKEKYGVSQTTISRRIRKNNPDLCVKCNQPKTRHKLWCEQSKEKARISMLSEIKRLRSQVIDGYGGKCDCCGEYIEEFLTIDHIYGRKEGEKRPGYSGWPLYRRLRQMGFPRDGYRLLCYNCNCSRGHRGYCPHELEDSRQLDLQRIPHWKERDAS